MAERVAPNLWRVQGRDLHLPVQIEDASMASAVFLPPRAAVAAALEPHGLRAVGVGGRGLALLVQVTYRTFVLGDGYEECGIAVLARRGRRIGVFTLFLPVTQDFTREAGQEIWGLPKWVCDCTAERVGSAVTRATWSEAGKPILDATYVRGRLRLPISLPLITPTWAVAREGPMAGSLLAGKGSMRPARMYLGRGRRSRMTWGEHPMADAARALGLDRAPVLVMASERMTGAVGESAVVARD